MSSMLDYLLPMLLRDEEKQMLEMLNTFDYPEKLIDIYYLEMFWAYKLINYIWLDT